MTTGYEPLNTLKTIGPDIWIADGPHISFYGLPFPTRMTVVRLADGGLWIHSPIKPDDKLIAQINKIGPVRHLDRAELDSLRLAPRLENALSRGAGLGGARG